MGLFSRRKEQVAPECKASAAGRIAALALGSGRAVWSARDMGSLTRGGFAGNPVGFRCVRLISEAAAAVPLICMDQGRRHDLHPVLDLLRRPNPGQGRAELFEALYGQLLLSGSGYLEAVGFRGDGLPEELHVLRSDRVSVVPGEDGWPVAYEYALGGRKHRFDMSGPVDPVCHIKSFHPLDDHYGLSPMQAAAVALDVHNAASAWSKALLDNAARPSGAIVYKGADGQGMLSPEQYDRLVGEIETNHQGARNAGRPMLLEGGLDWKQMGFSPSDMEFHQTKLAAAREIALAFGVPPMLLGIPGDATYANYAEAHRAFYRLTVLPMAAKVADSVAWWLSRHMGAELLLRPDLVGIRGAEHSYPAVAELRRLAADVRAVLGPQVKISYGADWSEYFGHQPGGGELFFHLDPLWADENIDFVAIDNYMPLSDWRDGDTHLDAHWGRIDDPGYLRANVMGGEGFDWYYASDADRDAQRRSPITDGTYDEPWVWRYKDIRSWWYNRHYDRPGGVRSRRPTAWVPESKPVWFAEFGCAALDKATNQPNRFLDAASSESGLPYYSDGRRDDALQAAAIRAVMEYWRDPANNPSMKGGGHMVDTSRAHVWCWDARPYPAFPARRDLWSDGPAWEQGHWLNGRAGAVPLASVVGDICRRAGVTAFDTGGLRGVVRGYRLNGNETGRAALQPLMLSYGFDAVERDGALRFIMRGGRGATELGPDDLAVTEVSSGFEITRAAGAEITERLRLTHVEAGGEYATVTAEAVLEGAGRGPGHRGQVSDSEMPVVLTRGEAQAMAARWLAEAQGARESARFALPPSYAELGPGDILRFRQSGGQRQSWRIDRVERAGAILIDAVRVEAGLYLPAETSADEIAIRPYVAPVPVLPVMMDLPLMRGDEVPHAPYLAIAARPWPGPVAAYMSVEQEGGFDLNLILRKGAVLGRTLSPLVRARPGMIDRGMPLRLQIKGGQLRSVGVRTLLSGANLMAIGDGSLRNWEVMQFARARVLGGDIWEISERLRGQAGTDSVMPREWPEGALVVLMDGAAQQVAMPPSARGQERYWRIGPARRGPDDTSHVNLTVTAQGIGLRPYAPCHLRVEGRRIGWTRRTRIDGDDWSGRDVPLGESEEVYLLRLRRGSELLHQCEVTVPGYEVPERIWLAAKAGGAFTAEVAQMSARFGAGPFVRRNIDGNE